MSTKEEEVQLATAATTANSIDAVQYIWRCWRYLGMHPTKRCRWLYLTISLLVNLFTGIIYPSLYLASFFLPIDFDDKLANLSVVLPLLYTAGKQIIMFYYIQTELPNAAQHLHTLDRYVQQRPEDIAYLRRIMRYCAWSFLTVFIGFWTALIFYGLLGIVRHRLPFEGWMPFDWQNSLGLYFLAGVIELFSVGILLTNAICCDTYTVAYLSLLVAHLRILNARIERLGECRERSETLHYQQLVACVEQHRECMSYYKCIRGSISGTIFVQFFSTALGLSVPAVTFVGGDYTLSQMMKFLIFFSAIIIEVAPSCWLMDEILLEMRKLTNSMFSCHWHRQNLKFRRSLIIFMQISQKVEPLLAGNIVPVSLETFTNIIKFAFSLFTLLNQLKS
ncbi:odorant receptor 2a-like [Zeugodacus cucurbitae]|uniref:odorant receptor 2a-like n=1 Tax=Zeugodacus cucurbitae TaxID=28588 RepID=UPI0023D95D93|nr:odorant receptor 2a-like [Zeugodacus cucurbitae]